MRTTVRLLLVLTVVVGLGISLAGYPVAQPGIPGTLDVVIRSHHTAQRRADVSHSNALFVTTIGSGGALVSPLTSSNLPLPVVAHLNASTFPVPVLAHVQTVPLASLPIPVTAHQGGIWNVQTISHVSTVLHVQAVALPADLHTTGSIATPGTDSFEVTMPSGNSIASVQFGGTWSGTVRVDGSVDGATWVILSMVRASDYTVNNQAVANGLFFVPVTGLVKFRVRFSSYTSGTLSFAIRVSSGPGPFTVNAVITDAQFINTNPIATNAGNVGGDVQRVVLATNQNTSQWNATVNQLGGAWNVSSAHQAGNWNVNHISTIAHVGLIGNLPCHSKAGFSNSGDFKVFHANTAFPRINICSIVIVASAASNVSLVEGTGAACATGVISILGSTAAAGANGMAFAANGGFSAISGTPWVGTVTAENDVCLLTSAGRVSGTITYRGF